MTTLDLTSAVVVGGLFAVGLHLLLQRSLMRLLFGFLVLGHATNLLVLLAAGPPGRPPITGAGDGGAGAFADPLPQAMALTAIVITFGVTVLLLALVYRGWQLRGHDEVRDDVEDRRLGKRTRWTERHEEARR
ncbi:Na(+)/H(+) antiporter subunit C [Streptomyces carminius]|uniref:Na(+)/H(+) antiporter subunit C n=1 Tax=Streptomyces carminius TaxID=2665496 RepID=A0A2M8M5V1_9ACTN|nr:Na(+)/H(+) antiporter subunit C [Streptomyces carminius]PJE99592.1 Na(+)/H(+) antiporter subunit C [Streptomyces carminius]